MICGVGVLIPDGVVLPDAGRGECCEDAAEDGPQACTCWDYVYDAERSRDLRRYDVPTPASPPVMCSDCAFRPGSPEKADDPHVVASSYQLLRCVSLGQPFWCHDGMPKVIGFRHPSGAYVPFDDDGAFSPRIVKSDDAATPFRADGRPAVLCSGWWLQRKKYLETEAV